MYYESHIVSDNRKMLRKEMREFLDTEWKRRVAYPEGHPERAKLKNYAFPSIYYNRIINQVRRAFNDLQYILDRLPPEQKQKIDLNDGLQKLMFQARKEPRRYPEDALTEALSSINVATDTIKQVFGEKDNTFYHYVLYPKVKEVQTLASFLAKNPKLATEKVQ